LPPSPGQQLDVGQGYRYSWFLSYFDQIWLKVVSSEIILLPEFLPDSSGEICWISDLMLQVPMKSIAIGLKQFSFEAMMT
jgi:hypothetical protein